jgi:hypothetical protein
MLSNVPGPQTAAHFGGQEIDDMAFVACSPIGLYCGLLSYNGQVSCSLCADTSAEGSPEKVTRYWKEEFDALYDETMAFEGGEWSVVGMQAAGREKGPGGIMARLND